MTIPNETTDQVLAELRQEAAADMTLSENRRDAMLALQQLVETLRRRGYNPQIVRDDAGVVRMTLDPDDVREPEPVPLEAMSPAELTTLRGQVDWALHRRGDG